MEPSELPLPKAEEPFDDYVEYIRQQDAALEQIELALYRMKRLAELSASDTGIKDTDRQQLQDEVEFLKSEIDGLAKRGKEFDRG